VAEKEREEKEAVAATSVVPAAGGLESEPQRRKDNDGAHLAELVTAIKDARTMIQKSERGPPRQMFDGAMRLAIAMDGESIPEDVKQYIASNERIEENTIAVKRVVSFRVLNVLRAKFKKNGGEKKSKAMKECWDAKDVKIEFATANDYYRFGEVIVQIPCVGVLALADLKRHSAWIKGMLKKDSQFG
jgi:hypothetical protein